ncbi:hypothetical protein GJ654_18895 [Rhodoblastus acidophilus]|uniref:Uncharacterized protein n=1 Tax=Rhodoblastus acidophilus TaxID=1074 RepID=A0A6N8DR12_RHOAC|nr:hypothetical protein [Rhodoblastus acidophilus]MCW2276397.1 hypothetical protein [Rhodoblastus acidophilus]MTV33052.1 hypothetical protein [Rhodoblastus acidophilus]
MGWQFNPFTGNLDWAGASTAYTLPIAGASTLGGVKVGSGLSIDGSGVLSAPGLTLPASVSFGTLTSSGSGLEITGTWNASGVAFPGALLVNVTNTNSAAGSKLADFQRDGSSVLSITPAGQINGRAGSYNNPTMRAGTSGSYLVLGSGDSGSVVGQGGATLFGSDGAKFSFAGYLDFNGAGNGRLYLDAAGIIAQRNGTNAQADRVYNTWTSGGAQEWFAIDWKTTANTCIVGTQATGAGAAVRPISAVGSWSFASPNFDAPFTVATLPAGVERANAYAIDGRKDGEGPGAGSGVPVFYSNGSWRRCSDCSPVAA